MATQHSQASHIQNKNQSPDFSCDAQSPSGSPVQSQVDYARIERAVREILFAVGENPDREGLIDTPSRVARMYAELFSGLHQDPRTHLKKSLY